MSGQDITDLLRSQHHDGVTWVDVDKPSSKMFAELEEQFHLHPVHLSESIQKVQHTEVEREDGYLFVVLHFPIFEFHSAEIRMGQVGVFLGKDFLVTVHTEAAPFIDSLFNECESDDTQSKDLFGQGAAYVLYKLIAKLLANIAAIADIVENELIAARFSQTAKSYILYRKERSLVREKTGFVPEKETIICSAPLNFATLVMVNNP